MNSPQFQRKAPAPTADEVRQARELAGLTLSAASGLVYRSVRNWQQWERAERQMDPALWELFNLKVKLLPGKN